MTKAEQSRNLRWRKPALAELNLNFMQDKLYEIEEACSNVHWAFDDDDELINALDGSEDEAWEFKMTFTALESEAAQLRECLDEILSFEENAEQSFNDMSVALIGNRFQTVGFDDYEVDYFSLTSYEQNLAQTEAGKRIMRKTKAEMLTDIGRCIGLILAFQNVQMQYEYIKAAIDIFKNENNSILKIVKEIEAEYEKAESENFYRKDTQKFERLVKDLPDRFWIE